MKRYTWLVSVLAAAGLFAVTWGLLRWSPVVCLVLSALLFAMLMLFRSGRREQHRGLPVSLRELDRQAEAFQQTALYCREASLRDAGCDLYATVKSLLDYLAVAPRRMRRLRNSLSEGLEGCRALVEEYLLQEEKGTLRPESLAETRAALQQQDACFNELLIRLLRENMSGTGSQPPICGKMQTEG